MRRRTRIGLLATIGAAALVVSAAAEARTYYGSVGPGSSISLRNAAGARVTSVPAGRHSFVVRDRSAAHNFALYRGGTRLRGTRVSGRGSVTWTLQISRGTYVYLCEPHSGSMRGSFRAR